MQQRFRTIEISDPQFEANNLRFITVKTPNLKGRGDICVYVPRIPNLKDLPIVLLLHGVYGSAWSWSQSSGVHIQADKLIKAGELPPMVIAMPSDGLWGDGSAFLPHNGYDFEKWIVEDVPDAIRECIKSTSGQSKLFIAGQSMGGFGAMRIGSKFGKKFSAVSGHSSIVSLAQIKFFAEESLKNYVQNDVTAEDVFLTMTRYKEALPPIRFDCGASDLLVKYNRQLHQKMTEAGMAHVYEEYPGGHEWTYWSRHVMTTLKFFAQYF